MENISPSECAPYSSCPLDQFRTTGMIRKIDTSNPGSTHAPRNVIANPTRLASCNGTQVSVIDALALKETGTITVGSGAVSVDVSGDALRAYAVAAHAGTISDIRVANNSVMTFAAPQQNLSCSNPSICPANVPQTPFVVRVFP